MKQIKAILFDMDGVLIDAREWHYQALNHALRHFDMEISYQDHLAAYDGLPTAKKLELLTIYRGLAKERYPEIMQLKQKFTHQLIQQNCKPIAKHLYALSKLKEEGYKIAVCSNSIRQTVELMMSKSQLISYLDFYLSNEDVKKPKPDPEIYIKAIKDLSLSPTECLIVEDNHHGIQAAKASGAYVLEVSSPDDVDYDKIISTISLIGAKVDSNA